VQQPPPLGGVGEAQLAGARDQLGEIGVDGCGARRPERDAAQGAEGGEQRAQNQAAKPPPS